MTQSDGRRSRIWLYTPIVIFTVIIAAYSTYWVWMRGQLETGIDDWIADQRAAGMTVEFSDKRLVGFPYRFALIVDDPRLADPSTGSDWSGDELQLIMQPWNFNHVIGRSPGRNLVILPRGEPMTAILGEKSVASLSWTDTVVDRFAMTLDDSSIVFSEGTMSFGNLSLNMGQTGDTPLTARFALDAERVALPTVPTEAPWLGDVLETVRIRLEAENPGNFMQRNGQFRSALDASQLNLAQFILNWGPVKLGAKGDVRLPFDTCEPNGTVNIRLEETADLIAALDNAGQLTEEIRTGIEAIGNVSRQDRFVPITLRNGSVTFLGQPITELPTLCVETERASLN
ncbi:MAG: DUF2125 domain-containing protein [Pseudomonadota bacterium]